ncbi:MAG: MliC family protein [Patescibacteria group bacterium]
MIYSKYKNLIKSLFIIVIFIVGTFLLIKKPNSTEEIENFILFECQSGNYLNGTFYENGTVDISIQYKDGVIFNEKLLKSGSRYYNFDKSIVFWSEGDEKLSTYLQKNGQIIENCQFLAYPDF